MLIFYGFKLQFVDIGKPDGNGTSTFVVDEFSGLFFTSINFFY